MERCRYDCRCRMEKLRTVVPVWTLYVEHGVNPSVKYYEKKRHHSEDSALKRALWIFRNPGWGIKFLSIDGTNGKRMAVGEIEAWCEHAAASEGSSE